MKTRIFLGLAVSFLFDLNLGNLLAQAPNPNENPQGDTGALKAQVTTGGSYDAHSGNATRIVNDVHVPGALGMYGLDFTRSWSSVHPEDTDMAALWPLDFGDTGWSHSWRWSAIFAWEEPDKEMYPPPYVWVSSITITFPDGHATKFKISRGFSSVGPPYLASRGETDWPSPGSEVHDHLAKMAENGTNFWLYRADGGSVHFEGGPSRYRATKIYDPHGFKTDLIYDGDLLIQVKQEEGNRWLDIGWKSYDGQNVIGKVETGGAAAGYQAVYYKYSRIPGALVLSSVSYADVPAVGQTSSAFYTYSYSFQGNQPGVGPQSEDPLLKQADDPKYAGAMTKIRYDYRGEGCLTNPSPAPNTDPHVFTPEAIKQERSGETGEAVSIFEADCAVGERKEHNGLGGERRLYYGGSANDLLLPRPLSSYQLTKATDFGPLGSNFSALPASRQTGAEPEHVWDGRLHRTDLTYDNSGGVAQVIHHEDGSSVFYDRVNPGDSDNPDTTRIRNPYHHWLFSKRDEKGNVTTYKRDPRRRVTEIKYYDGPAQGTPVAVENYTYNEWNQVTSHTLPSHTTEHPAVVHYHYNALHQLAFEYNTVQGLDERKEYIYDALGRVEKMRDARAIRDNAPYTERMEYNGRHQITKIHYRPTGGASDPTVTYEYDKYGNRTAVIDELGHRKDYTYDAYRRCTSLTEQVGPTAGCNSGQVRRWDWIFDRVIDGESQARPASAHTSKEWRVQIEPAFNDSGHRRATARTFDVNNRIFTEQTGLIQLSSAPLGTFQPPGPDAETHSFAYNENGQKSRFTDPRGRVTTYTYDARNRLWTTTEPKRLNQPDYPVTRFQYDVAGNKERVTFPDQTTQRWENYDPFGQPGRFFDERENKTDLTYQWGPMKKLATVTTHRRKDNGDWEDQPTVFNYDALGRPAQTVFPDGTTEETTYQLGQLKSYKTRRGQKKVVDVYDERGREKHHYWLTPQNAVDLRTPAISRLWDDASRLMKIWNSFSIIDYTYDTAGGVRTEGTTVAESGGLHEVRYCRYPNGEVSQITYPNGTTVNRNYTARGQLQDTNWNGGKVSYAYLPDGKVDHQDYGNTAITTASYGYDGRGMIDWMRLSKSGHDLARRDYWRDDRDRIVAWTKGTDNSINPMEDGRGDRYEYDWEGQLTKASYQALLTPPGMVPSQAKRSDIFYYDELGNRRGSNYVASRGWMDFPRRDNKLNQYLAWTPYSAIYHDDNMPAPSPAPTPPAPPFPWVSPGNGVVMQDGYITASYNALNQPVAIWSPVYPGANGSAAQYLWYGHDPLGRCVKRWMGTDTGAPAGSTPTTYFYFDGWNLIQEDNSTSTPLRVYVHGNRVDEIVASQSGGGWSYHHYDARGHCIMLTDTNGAIREQYDYDAFGYPYFYSRTGDKLSPANQWGNRFLFTGREWLRELKVYDYRNRIYQPELGRFLQPDPKEFEAGDYNLYRYCHNDPVNHTDPDGTERISADVIWEMAKRGDSGNNPQGSLIDQLVNAHNGATRADRAAGAFSLQNPPGRLPDLPIDPPNHYRDSGAPREGDLTPGQAAFVTAVFLTHGELREYAAVRGLGLSGIANPVPSTMARVIPEGVPTKTLGRTGEANVFVTAADDIAGMNASQIANRLGVPQSPTGFRVFEFPTPQSGVASPVFRSDQGFIGGGLTTGGAREFVIPNGPMPFSEVRIVP